MQRPGFLQQCLDHLLLLVITALSPMAVAPFAGGVEEVMGRPGLVVERLPDPEVVIDSHRVPDPQFLHLLTHVIQHFFVVVLGGVHADHHQAVKWEVSTLICFSRPSTRLHSAGKNNRVNTVPTRTPPIST